jgi:hypothetical protein
MIDPNVAALIAVAMGLVRIVEKIVEWGVKKMSGEEKKAVVVLDPDTTRIINEIHSRTLSLTETIGLRDPDGVPMVYSSRQVAEDVRATALVLRDISYTQQKLLDRLEALDDRVEDVQSTQRAQARR